MEKTTYISFPGLGIGEFRVDNVAFTVFGRNVMWYGIIITIGIIAAYLYVNYRAKHNERIKSDDVMDYAIYLVVFGIIGARLYYVFTKFDNFKGDTFGDTLYNIIAVWEGGLAIYGGIIAGFLALVVVSLVKKIRLGKALDMVAPGVMLGQLIGRWGNFCNAEAFGGETTLPWRMGLRDVSEESAIYVHPTFLYESLWNLLGFILINILYKRKKFDGQNFLLYISWYGFGRMFIEGLRTDSLYVGDFRISQLVGFFCFFFGAALLTAMLIVTRLRKKDAALAAALADTGDAVLLPSDLKTAAESENAAVKSEDSAAESDPADRQRAAGDDTAQENDAAKKKAAPMPEAEQPLPSDRTEEAPAQAPAPAASSEATERSASFDISAAYADDDEEDDDPA